MATVKVVNDRSPWLKGMLGNTYTIPFSHGEGSLYAQGDALKTLIQNGQIATQYVDFNGNPSLEAPFNPNGSTFAIEGLVSPCGRIYGRMGHPERYQEGLLQNIPTSGYHNIFKNAVEFFTQPR